MLVFCKKKTNFFPHLKRFSFLIPIYQLLSLLPIPPTIFLINLFLFILYIYIYLFIYFHLEKLGEKERDYFFNSLFLIFVSFFPFDLFICIFIFTSFHLYSIQFPFFFSFSFLFVLSSPSPISVPIPIKFAIKAAYYEFLYSKQQRSKQPTREKQCRCTIVCQATKTWKVIRAKKRISDLQVCEEEMQLLQENGCLVFGVLDVKKAVTMINAIKLGGRDQT